MTRLLLHTATGGLLLVLAIGAAFAADDKAADSDKASKEKKQVLDKLASAGDLSGNLTRWGEGTAPGAITLRVTIKYNVPNAGAINNVASLQRQLLDAQRIPNPIDRQAKLLQIQTEMAKNQNNLTTTKEEHYDYELVADDNMKVRHDSPPPQFDDKGKLKPYTPKELKTLKGNDKLPGFPAEMDALKQGQTVKVFLAKPKKNATKEKDDKAADNRPKVTMVLILSEPASK
jgi:hypothetical protein